MHGTDDGMSWDGNSADGSHPDLTPGRQRPPTAGGKKVQLPGQRRPDMPMGRVNSLASNGNGDQRRGSVQALLNQFNTFATDLQETHEIDIKELKKDVDESLEMIKDMISMEHHGRKDGDAALQKRCDALEKALAQQRPSESDKKRLDHLENMFAAWADKNTRDMESIRRAQESLSKELASFNAAHEQHLEVEQSLDTAVKGLTSAAEQTAKALAAAKSKLDHLHENVLSCEQHCTATEHKSTLVAESVKSMETKISVTSEHVLEMNRKFESSISKLLKEMEALKSECDGFSNQVKQKLSDTNNLINQHAASQNGRLDPLEKGHSDLLSRHDGQSRDLKGLKDDHKKRSQELVTLRQYVDNGLGDLADSTARELKATRKDFDQMRASMEQQNESRSTKAKIESLQESVTTCEKHVTSVEKHLTETEKRLESNIRVCSKGLESIKGDHGNLTQHVSQRLADANDRIEKQQRANTDAHDGRHNDLLSKCDGQARDIQSLRQHIDDAIHDLAQNTAREIKATREDVDHLKASHDEVGPAISSKIEHVQQTVNGCERRVTTVETKTTKIIEEVQETERRLETNVRNCTKDIENLRGDHGNLSNQVKQKMTDANDLIANHVASHARNSDDKLNDLLGKHKDLLSKHEGHAKDIRHLWDETGRHNQDLGSLRQDLNNENAKRGQDVNILRQHLDGALGDISQNTARELKASRDDLDQVLALLSGVQRAWRARQKRISDGGGSRGSSPKRLYSEELNSPTSSKVAYKPLGEQKTGGRRSSCLL